jgi:arsenite-transporting ATPase
LQDDEVIGLVRLADHGAQLFGDVDPAARLPSSGRVRFERREDGYQVRIPLPGARTEELDVAVVDDELVVRAGSRRRALKLPRRIAACTLDGAVLNAGELVVAFEAGASRGIR